MTPTILSVHSVRGGTGKTNMTASLATALADVEDKITKTNASRAFDYPYLLPSQIPASTNI